MSVKQEVKLQGLTGYIRSFSEPEDGESPPFDESHPVRIVLEERDKKRRENSANLAPDK